MLLRTTWSCVFILAALACGGSASTVCRPDSITGTEHCEQAGGAPDAALTGGVAAGVWAAKGCTVNGCEPPFICNPKNKLCERQHCSETTACPPPYLCKDYVCR